MEKFYEINKGQEWWGYKHINGTYQVKRFFNASDIIEAYDSFFCEIIVGPFYADGREKALKIIKEKIENKKT